MPAGTTHHSVEVRSFTNTSMVACTLTMDPSLDRLGLGGLNTPQLPHASGAAPALAPMPPSDLPMPAAPPGNLGVPVPNQLGPKVPMTGQPLMASLKNPSMQSSSAGNSLPYMNGRPGPHGQMPLSMPLGMPVDGVMNGMYAAAGSM